MQIRQSQWAKLTPFVEKFLLDVLLPRRNLLLMKVGEKNFLARTLHSAIQFVPNELSSLLIWSVGNSHLDSAWLWRKQDSREKKIFPTFSRAIYHIDKYPNFYFTANAAVHYYWIREDVPDLFMEIKKSVEDGRWEPVGGDWVEMDVNLPDGESLIRQRLIGQRFYLKEFGKLAEVAWYDDVFGFCQTLPQILAKSGAKFFYTNKFCYNNYSIKFDADSPKYVGGEKFPFLHFVWQSPDGSKVLCSWTTHKNNFHKHLKHFNLHSRTVDPQQDRHFDYSVSWQEMEKRLGTDVVPLLLNIYGHGDGGMGPRPLEILDQLMWERLKFVQIGPIQKFFDQLAHYQDRLPIWTDELYLENHQGTLTSVGMIKENNHTAEVLMHQAEVLSVIGGLFGGSPFQEDFYDDWQNLLFLQFHDVLPGSSIVEVYRDAAQDYNSIFRDITSCIENSLNSIAQGLKTSDKRNCLTIFNPLSWKREGFIVVPRKNFNAALDGENRPLIVQPIALSSYVANREIQLGLTEVVGTDYLKNPSGQEQLTAAEEGMRTQDKLLIYLPPTFDIGSFGIANILLLEGNYIEKPNEALRINETPTDFQMENQYLRMRIAKNSGRIIEIAKKQQTQEQVSHILGTDGIGYHLFQDEKTQFDAWNLDPEFRSKRIIFPAVQEIKIEEHGPLRITLSVKYRPTEAHSSVITRLSLYHHDKKIYGETLVDWQEDHKLLTLCIDTTLNSSKISCGIPFGVQERCTKPRTVWEEARCFQFVYQQFAYWTADNEAQPQSTDPFQGIVFYSQSKFGMSANAATMDFTFLKAANFEPHNKKYATLDADAPHCQIIDHGFHRIPWALELFESTDCKMTAITHGYEYNNPLIAFSSNYQHPKTEFFRINCPNVLISTIKEIEAFIPEAPDWFYKPNMSELAFIMRCVEYKGLQTACQIQIHSAITVKSVREVDFLERIENHGLPPQEIISENHQISFVIQPFEIKSLMVIARIPFEDQK